jgi:uncharacterized protein YhaN
MRFSRLTLNNFGHFASSTLLFRDENPDFHLIYGPNEAGKSTTRAAIGDYLFGFGHHAHYAFQFDASEMRVSAQIRIGDEMFGAERRRGRANTLRNLDGEPIDEELLARVRGGVDRERFEQSYSLDHQALRHGGNAMLQAKDDAASALFSAGSGIRNLTQLLADIEAEGKSVWTPRKSGSSFYVTRDRLDQFKREIAERKVRPQRWIDLEKEIEQGAAEFAALETEIQRLRSELANLEHRVRAAPRVARLAVAETALSALGPVPAFAAGAEEAIAELHRRKADATARLTLAKPREAEAAAELERFPKSFPVAALASDIADLNVGQLRKAREDAPGLQARLALTAARIDEVRRELGWAPADIASTRAALATEVSVAVARTRLSDVQTARREVEIADDAVTKAKCEFDAVPVIDEPVAQDLRPLEVAAQLSVTAGDLAAQRSTLHERKRTANRELDAAMQSLFPWTGELETLAQLALPGNDVATTIESAIATATQGLHAAEGALTSARDLGMASEERLSVLQARFESVSDAQLLEARKRRDDVWVDLQPSLLEGVRRSAGDIERLTSEIRTADLVADVRQSQAENVADLAAAERAAEQARAEVTRREVEVARLRSERDAHLTRWEALMSPLGLVGFTVADLRAWTSKRAAVLAAARALAEITSDIEEIDRQEARLLHDLNAALVIAGHHASELGFTGTLAMATRVLEDERARTEQVQRRRAELKLRSDRLDQARETLEAAKKKRDTAEAEFLSAATLLGVDATDLVLFGARLDLLSELRTRCSEAVDLQRRLDGMARDLEAFLVKLRLLAERAEVQIAENDDPLNVQKVLAELSAQQTAQRASRDEVEKKLRRAADDRKEAELEIQALADALQELADSAGVDVEELATSIAKTREAAERQREIRQLRTDIVEHLDLAALPEFISTIEERGPHAETIERSLLTEKLEELQARHAMLLQERGRRRQELTQLGSGGEAAESLSDFEGAKAELAAETEKYVRSRARLVLLRLAIERYRDENQGPLLTQASLLFSNMTAGRYERLIIDNSDSKLRIVAVREGGRRVDAGGMSEGTRDLLFLAIRTAALQNETGAAAQLPFIADDLFVAFDDDRARAGLVTLMELAKTRQVLFFTHHQRLKEIAVDITAGQGWPTCELARIPSEGLGM